ncbi:hypothetical protein QIH40_26640, partial [Klebsiella pneumoniae]|nr:hypothetical protein [Klebsiella pneumoniae]
LVESSPLWAHSSNRSNLLMELLFELSNLNMRSSLPSPVIRSSLLFAFLTQTFSLRDSLLDRRTVAPNGAVA